MRSTCRSPLQWPPLSCRHRTPEDSSTSCPLTRGRGVEDRQELVLLAIARVRGFLLGIRRVQVEVELRHKGLVGRLVETGPLHVFEAGIVVVELGLAVDHLGPANSGFHSGCRPSGRKAWRPNRCFGHLIADEHLGERGIAT
jgi:hypothetical protein